MKKISYLELASIFLTIIITFNIGINMYLLKQSVNQNAWIAIIISYLIGFIPLYITLYISNYKPNLNLFEKNKALFGDIIGNIINIAISIILSIIAITLLNNISNFITSQFLYRTPKIITISLLIILAIYCSSKEINVIAHTSIILIALNLIMFLTSNLSLINNIKIDNLLPIQLINQSNIFIASIKITIINILPIITILIIPKNKVTNQEKYNKALTITYIIGFIISIITIINTISTLGIYLTKIYEYSEYIALKTIRLLGFLERSENIISLSWISETYIYITFIIYTISKNIPSKNDKTFTYTNTIIGLFIIILTNHLFKNITIFNNYITNTFIIITSMLFAFYIIIYMKILLTKKRKITKESNR